MADFGFGIYDCKIAALTDPSVPTYDTAVDVEVIQLMGVSIDMISAMLEGDDGIADVHSKPISGQVRMRFGFGRNHLAVWAILLNKPSVDSGDDTYLVIGDENPDYFGVCGRINHTSGGGDLHIWMPKCKLMEGLSLEAQYNSYMTPEVSVKALKLNDTHGMIVPIMHETAVPVAIPAVFGE